MEPIGIFALVVWGMIVCIVPLLLLFEIYHWIRKKDHIELPLLKGIITGSLIGIIVIYFQIKSASGESGLIAMAISPFIFLGFVIAGGFVGLFYKIRTRPLLPRKFKKQDV